MKKYISFIINFICLLICAAAIIFVGWNQEEHERRQKTIDSLNMVVSLRNSENSDITKTLSEINENLKYIKEQEGITNVNLDEAGDNSSVNDINAIYQRLLDNKQKIATLQRRLNKELGKNKQYDELIAQLQATTESKMAEIEALTQDNRKKDVKITTLEKAINNLSQSIDSLTTVNTDILTNLDNTVAKLNTRYYIVSDKGDLKDKGLIETGLFKGKKAKLDDKSLSRYFKKIDLRNVNSIPLNGKKATLLTSHPSSSYTIDEDYTQLTITNKDDFWSQSNCLVVCTK